MQTVKTLIRRRVLWRLIRVYIACKCPFYGALGLNALIKIQNTLTDSGYLRSMDMCPLKLPNFRCGQLLKTPNISVRAPPKDPGSLFRPGLLKDPRPLFKNCVTLKASTPKVFKNIGRQSLYYQRFLVILSSKITCCLVRSSSKSPRHF